MILLQQLTDREAQILEEQDEGKKSKFNFRRWRNLSWWSGQSSRNWPASRDETRSEKRSRINWYKLKKESQVLSYKLGEWLALVQKRDDLLKSGSLIGLQRSRAKLEIEYLHVQRQCRVLSLKHEYEKTEEDRNLEESLIQQCVKLVSNKAIIEDDMATLEEEIQEYCGKKRHN